MNRYRNRRHSIEHDDVHRWLVSYADYMTLLFALFVVLYAMAMVNEEPFETITESIGRVFQANEELPKNKGHGDDILPVNSKRTEQRLFGNGILEEKGPELTEGDPVLSNVADKKVGTNLESLEEDLNTALYEIIESGYAQLQVDGDWLEIELNSALLFPSGSSSTTNNADAILMAINDILGGVTNFIRVRGYTDDQPINNEIFASNWELSVHRATAVLRLMEQQQINPARMAIEGYGQYYPDADNNTAEGRAQNRKVVIAISKFGLNKDNLLDAPKINVDDLKSVEEVVDSSTEDNKIRVIRLENGGIRITTRAEDNPESAN